MGELTITWTGSEHELPRLIESLIALSQGKAKLPKENSEPNIWSKKQKEKNVPDVRKATSKVAGVSHQVTTEQLQSSHEPDKPKSKEKVPLTPEQHTEILKLHAADPNMTAKGIGDKLGIDARRVHGYIMSQSGFKAIDEAMIGKAQPEPEKAVAVKLENQSIISPEISIRIFELQEEGLSPKGIADTLFEELGEVLSEPEIAYHLVEKARA